MMQFQFLKHKEGITVIIIFLKCLPKHSRSKQLKKDETEYEERARACTAILLGGGRWKYDDCAILARNESVILMITV